MKTQWTEKAGKITLRVYEDDGQITVHRVLDNGKEHPKPMLKTDRATYESWLRTTREVFSR